MLRADDWAASMAPLAKSTRFARCRNLNSERAHGFSTKWMTSVPLKVQQEFADSPWDIVGIYHSHPDHPSKASQTDTDRALPKVILMSLFPFKRETWRLPRAGI